MATARRAESVALALPPPFPRLGTASALRSTIPIQIREQRSDVMWVLLTRGLTWFGIAVVVARLVTPRSTERLTSVGRQSRVRREVGARELVAGIGRVVRRQRTGSRWSRMAASAADVAAISAALGGRGRRVSAIGLLAALTAMRARRGKKPASVRPAR
jgi:hypothetical protein